MTSAILPVTKIDVMNERAILRANARQRRNRWQARKLRAFMVRVGLLLGATILVMFLRSRY